MKRGQQQSKKPNLKEEKKTKKGKKVPDKDKDKVYIQNSKLRIAETEGDIKKLLRKSRKTKKD